MRIGTVVLLLTMTTWAGGARAQAGDEDKPGAFPKGLPDAPDFFPIAVWLQDTANAEKYRAVGVNLYVGLWRGPTVEQLDALDAAGIRLIAGQSPRSLAFRDRRVKKRQFRRLWIVRINAACRMRGLRYSEFMYGLQLANVMLDRKSLSETAIHDPAAFDKLVELAKKHLPKPEPKKPEAKKEAAKK